MSTENHAADCAQHTVVTAENGKLVRRDVTMTFHRAGRALPIEHMFDAQGSETFDPTEAVEVDADGELFRLAEGDRITMTVEVGA
jgi:hypothetical protein